MPGLGNVNERLRSSRARAVAGGFGALRANCLVERCNSPAQELWHSSHNRRVFTSESRSTTNQTHLATRRLPFARDIIWGRGRDQRARLRRPPETDPTEASIRTSRFAKEPNDTAREPVGHPVVRRGSGAEDMEALRRRGSQCSDPVVHKLSTRFHGRAGLYRNGGGYRRTRDLDVPRGSYGGSSGGAART